jgi:hypothetical protein
MNLNCVFTIYRKRALTAPHNGGYQRKRACEKHKTSWDEKADSLLTHDPFSSIVIGDCSAGRTCNRDFPSAPPCIRNGLEPCFVL